MGHHLQATGVDDGSGAFADGAPTGRGPRVQSGRMPREGKAFPSKGASPLSSSIKAWYSSHFSRGTSTPPVFKDLPEWSDEFACLNGFCAHPASEPPTQANVAGENAGAFPAFAIARADVDGGGDGWFRIAKWGKSGRRGPYLS